MSQNKGMIAVFGATGAQGGPVVRALQRAGRPVRAIARTEAHLQPLASAQVDIAVADLADFESVKHALEGVSGAFVHLPFIPVGEVVEAYARNVVRALSAAQVPLTVFTLSGPAPTSPTGIASFDSKAVAAQVFQRADVPVIMFQPVGYLANLSDHFSAPNVVKYHELRYALPAEHRQPWISVEDQAALTVAALERPDLAGRTFRIGEQLTGHELAAGISEGVGHSIRYVAYHPQMFWGALTPMMDEQIVKSLVDDYEMLGSRPASLNLDADTQAIRHELGLPATALANWARAQNWEEMAAPSNT